MNRRNIGIIAHVDHGKTTLVDHMLSQAGNLGSSPERAMDSLDLEKERGITIQSKNAAVEYGELRINIVDTPGHADFGGEVERILGMVDGALLLVDAAEGPLPQTRFVLEKALAQGHRIVLVINKVDRATTERIQQVVNETFDLFIDLGASDEQADFPILYACAKEGWCTPQLEDIAQGSSKNLEPLFEVIRHEIPAPPVSTEASFQMLVSQIGWSDYLGQLAVGRVENGRLEKNTQLFRQGVDDNGENTTQRFTVSHIFLYSGLQQKETDSASAGEIIVLSGCPDFEIGDTLVDTKTTPRLPRIYVEPPTLAMTFAVNTSPFSGKEGSAVQSRKLYERLLKESRHNVAIRVVPTNVPDQFSVYGRGELQFSILVEEMRREGLEFMVGQPIVVTKKENGLEYEPLERATLDLPEAYVGDVTQMFQQRQGRLVNYLNMGARTRLEFDIPTRGLIGLRTRYLTATRGEGLWNSRFIGYTAWKGPLVQRTNGALVADRQGQAVEYALVNLEDRGTLFIEPGTSVYPGMIIGEFNKDTDLEVNPCKEKKLTNVRSVTSDGHVPLRPPRRMSLEECIEWIEKDEWIEVTPRHIRLRKTTNS